MIARDGMSGRRLNLPKVAEGAKSPAKGEEVAKVPERHDRSSEGITRRRKPIKGGMFAAYQKIKIFWSQSLRSEQARQARSPYDRRASKPSPRRGSDLPAGRCRTRQVPPKAGRR